MCKKGAACEFRHSEAARRNPRDCYYWMSWGCNKADCAFRHPPLGRPPGAAPPPAFPGAEDKSRTPCFFFARGAQRREGWVVGAEVRDQHCQQVQHLE
ncbi:unnamed protein product [Closterium sp. Yama58-4]|nr:unnamed protein product [Closterium sp. Yama58-4]